MSPVAWIVAILAFLLGLLIGWLLFRSRSETTVTAAAPSAAPVAAAPLVAAPVSDASAKKIAQLEKELAACRASATVAAVAEPKPEPVLNLAAAAKALGKTIKLNDLKVVEGIGPKIEELIKAEGVTTWRALSVTDVATLQKVLDAAGPRYRMHDPKTWPRQSALLADGKWAAFKTLTDKLSGGR